MMSKHRNMDRPLTILSYLHRRNFQTDEHLRQKFLRDQSCCTKTLYQRDLKGHYGCVNAIEFSNGGGEWIISGGDDRRVLLWNSEKAIGQNGRPTEMKLEHNSNIFALAFDRDNRKIISGGNDEIAIVHDIESGEAEDVYRHEDAVYGLSSDPVNDSIFASACADGRVLIYDIRAPPSEDPFCLANYVHPMHSVMYNPVEPRLLVTANSKEGLGLWDIRKPRSCVLRYGLTQSSYMSVRFNQSGSHLLALQRRHSPVLFAVHSQKPLFFFDHPGYLNSCTMKSCCFGGENDQYALSGSDDFNLYMWKIPDEPQESNWVSEAHAVLKGHRSIVNQVRCNHSNQLIISSGVEKVIKLWSPFHLPPRSTSELPLRDANSRPIYTHEEYINLVRRSGAVMSHDYRHQSTEEDPCMMAFFDSLIQRELEGWRSSDSEADFFSSASASPQPFAAESHTESESDNDDTTHSDHNPITVAFASLMARQELAGVVSEDGSRMLELDLTLADDLFNNREEERPVVSTNRVRGSGAGPASSSSHQRQNSENSSAGNEPGIMPGQRPLVNRRSISDLISLKRREYFLKKGSARGSLKDRARKRTAREANMGDTSDGSETESGNTNGAFSSASSSRSSSSCSESDPHETKAETEEVFSEILKQHTRDSAEMQRLKKLRSRVLHSDTSSDSEDDVVCCACKATPLPGQLKVCAGTDDAGREVGPLLTEAQGSSCTKCKNSLESTSKVSEEQAQPSTSGLNQPQSGSDSNSHPGREDFKKLRRKGRRYYRSKRGRGESSSEEDI